MARKELDCEKSYSETGIITVLKSVARIRLVKIEKTKRGVIYSVEISNNVIH
jgi:hypothetical protein